MGDLGLILGLWRYRGEGNSYCTGLGKQRERTEPGYTNSWRKWNYLVYTLEIESIGLLIDWDWVWGRRKREISRVIPRFFCGLSFIEIEKMGKIILSDTMCSFLVFHVGSQEGSGYYCYQKTQTAALTPGDLPNQGIKPRSPTLQANSLPAEPQGKPRINARMFSILELFD